MKLMRFTQLDDSVLIEEVTDLAINPATKIVIECGGKTFYYDYVDDAVDVGEVSGYIVNTMVFGNKPMVLINPLIVQSAVVKAPLTGDEVTYGVLATELPSIDE